MTCFSTQITTFLLHTQDSLRNQQVQYLSYFATQLLIVFLFHHHRQHPLLQKSCPTHLTEVQEVGFYKFGGTGPKTNIGAITVVVLIASSSATTNTVPNIVIVIRSQTKTSARCTWITTCRTHSFISSGLIYYNTITIACTTNF